MDEALVKNAKNDVNGDERSQDEQRFVGEGTLEGGCSPLKITLDGRGHVQVRDSAFNPRDGSAEGGARSKIEGNGDGGKLALASNREWSGGALKARKGTQGHSVTRMS